MSGGAYAASTLITGSQIAHHTIGSGNIKQGTIGLSNLNSSLRKKLATATSVSQLSGTAGPAGATGPAGTNGTNGAAGAVGATGASGAKGDAGSNGTNGTNGTNGVNSPFVYTYTGSKGPDSGACGDWATDTYDRTFVVEPQVDGSFTVAETVQGTFVTAAGVSSPNPGSCPGTTQAGGVTGTFYGTETFSIPSPGSGQAADFNPLATCGSDCSPDTSNSSNSSNDAGNNAFVAAFFPGAAAPSVTNYDFVYTTPSNTHGHWTDSNTPENNQGNITG